MPNIFDTGIRHQIRADHPNAALRGIDLMGFTESLESPGAGILLCARFHGWPF